MPGRVEESGGLADCVPVSVGRDGEGRTWAVVGSGQRDESDEGGEGEVLHFAGVVAVVVVFVVGEWIV